MEIDMTTTNAVATAPIRRSLLDRLRGVVPGQVKVGGVAAEPVDPQLILKEQLRASLIARRGIHPLAAHAWTTPSAYLAEVTPAPVLDISKMAAKRAIAAKNIGMDGNGVLHAVKADQPNATVKAVEVHHRAVVKEVEVVAEDVVLSEAAREFLGDVLADALEAPVVLEVPHVEAVDLRFWDNFFARISAKNDLMDVADDAHLLSMKESFNKGYYPIREMGTAVCGIVHVTKNSMNALYLVDREQGVFRTVSCNNRFNSASEAGSFEAKAFLNGRY
jgi:hypothetical protein